MTSAQIRTLILPASISQGTQKTLSYLDERFSDFDSLGLIGAGTLDEEFEESSRQEAELASEFNQSTTDLSHLLSSAKTSAHGYIGEAQDLSLMRHQLMDELGELAGGLLSATTTEDNEGSTTTLLQDLETLHRNLDDLQGVKGYVVVVKRVLELSETALIQVTSLSSSTPISVASVTQFQALQAFVASVVDACSSVLQGEEASGLHLITFLNRVRDKTWADIKKSLATPLLQAAESIGWPMPVDYASASEEKRKAFEGAFGRLVGLQVIAERINAPKIYPLETLVQPIALRFKYHFEGTRGTNRVDKPEWYLTHILNVIHDHRSFIEDVIQPLIDFSSALKVDAWDEFITLLLPLPSKKLQRTVPSLLAPTSPNGTPALGILAHTIYQTLEFDKAVRGEGYTAVGVKDEKETGDEEEVKEWKGISQVILGKKEWFDAWLDGERRFAESQYNEIISSPNAWVIPNDDDDDVDGTIETNIGPAELKTTNSARKVKALIENVTDRYTPLPSPLHQTRFLLYTQIPILLSYLKRIEDSLDAYEALAPSTSSFSSGGGLIGSFSGAAGSSLGLVGSFGAGIMGMGASGNTAISGSGSGGVNLDTARFASGIEGIQRLCKALLSSKFLESAMEAWGEDLFFLELGAEILRRPGLQAVVKVSGLPLGSGVESTGGSGADATVFDTLISRYRKCTQRCEELIVQQVCVEVEVGLKSHLVATNATATSPNPANSSNSPHLQSESETNNNDNNDLSSDTGIALSQTLLPPLSLLSSHLTHLRSTLPPNILTFLYRNIATRLAEHLLHRQILYRGKISKSRDGGKRGEGGGIGVGVGNGEVRRIKEESEVWVDTCCMVLLAAQDSSNGWTRNRIEAPWLRLIQASRLVCLEGEGMEKVGRGIITTLGKDGEDEEQWENLMIEVVGCSVLTREEVERILRRVD